MCMASHVQLLLGAWRDLVGAPSTTPGHPMRLILQIGREDVPVRDGFAEPLGEDRPAARELLLARDGARIGPSARHLHGIVRCQCASVQSVRALD